MKRRLSDIAFEQMLNDAVRAEGVKSLAGPRSPLLVQTGARSGRLLGFRRLYDFGFNVGLRRGVSSYACPEQGKGASHSLGPATGFPGAYRAQVAHGRDGRGEDSRG
jgi:hypothetical protein